MYYIDKLVNFRNKTVVVTGATGQLGTQISVAFQDTGAKVIGLDLKMSTTESLGNAIEYRKFDVTKKSEVASVFGNIVDKYGKIDVLINNAGVSCFEPFDERPEESFDWVTNVNLKGTFFCVQAYSRLAKRLGFQGSIVNIASIYGVVSPDPRIYTDCARQNSEVYGATKAGIIQMTRYFAVHLAAIGVRVNCVSPGGIVNPVTPQGEDFQRNYGFRCPMGRMADTQEMLGAIFYLASDAASYTTGQNIVVDGGMSCW